MDEAQLQLAEETDYSRDFEEDLRGNVEHGDVYDEHLAQLPEFEVHKLGKNLGWTQLPIVTRRKALWSTPLPRTRPFSHSWAWLYTKPPTAATQRQKQTTTISPEVNNKIEKSVINDKMERKEERIKKISEETIKTTTPRIMLNETNLNTKSLETTKTNKEREQQTNKTKAEKEKTPETTQTTTFSTNKATTLNREEQQQINIKTKQLEKEKTEETTKTSTQTTTKTSTQTTTTTTLSLNKTPTKTTQLEKEKEETTTRTTTTTTFSPNKLIIEKEEKEHLIERLRKLLKNANLKGVFPSENNKVVVEVRSNVIAIEPAVDSKNVDPSKTGSGFAWPRSWENNEADDRLAIRSWAREHSRQPDHQLILPFQNNSDEGEEPISTPKQLPNILQSSIQFTTTIKIPTTIKTTTKVPTTARKKGVVKPTFFNSGTHRHTGPTFNCRVLDAAVDGIPSENNDQTCPLDFPGIASDKSCKCTYEVSGRDEEGCATGFIYTCLRTVKSSNNDLKS